VSVLALLLGLLLGSSCGNGHAAKGTQTADRAAEESASDESGSDEGEGSERAEVEPASGPNCDDGSCSLCAGSLCPTGWYCDENAKACGWLRECPEKPSCACITRVLGSSCKCSEESGVPRLEC
jgi:hypothetical protein